MNNIIEETDRKEKCFKETGVLKLDKQNWGNPNKNQQSLATDNNLYRRKRQLFY